MRPEKSFYRCWGAALGEPTAGSRASWSSFFWGLAPGPLNPGRAPECLSLTTSGWLCRQSLPRPSRTTTLPRRSPSGWAPWTKAWLPTWRWPSDDGLSDIPQRILATWQVLRSESCRHFSFLCKEQSGCWQWPRLPGPPAWLSPADASPITMQSCRAGSAIHQPAHFCSQFNFIIVRHLASSPLGRSIDALEMEEEAATLPEGHRRGSDRH